MPRTQCCPGMLVSPNCLPPAQGGRRVTVGWQGWQLSTVPPNLTPLPSVAPLHVQAEMANTGSGRTGRGVHGPRGLCGALAWLGTMPARAASAGTLGAQMAAE